MPNIFVWLSPVAIASMSGMIYWTVEINQRVEKITETRESRFMTTKQYFYNNTFNVTSNCRQIDCVCRASNGTSCSYLIENGIEGTCNGGSACCQNVFSVCVPEHCLSIDNPRIVECSCYEVRTLIGNDVDGLPILVRDVVCSGQNCNVNCPTTRCDQRCTQTIENRECRVICDRTKRLDFYFYHVPERIYKDRVFFDVFQNCTRQSSRFVNCLVENNYPYMSSGTAQCGSDETDTGCATRNNVLVNTDRTMHVDLENANILSPAPIRVTGDLWVETFSDALNLNNGESFGYIVSWIFVGGFNLKYTIFLVLYCIDLRREKMIWFDL